HSLALLFFPTRRSSDLSLFFTFLFFLPLLGERFFCEIRQFAMRSPRFSKKVAGNKVFPFSTKEIDEFSLLNEIGETFPYSFFHRRNKVLLHRITSVEQQHFVNVDPHRAYFGTFATKT